MAHRFSEQLAQRNDRNATGKGGLVFESQAEIHQFKRQGQRATGVTVSEPGGAVRADVVRVGKDFKNYDSPNKQYFSRGLLTNSTLTGSVPEQRKTL